MLRLILSSGVLAVCGAALLAKPDRGPKLLAVSDRAGNAEIYLMDPDGGNAVNLTNHKADDSFPAWSPDGTRIAFTSDRDGGPGLYVMDADGANVKRITKGKGISRAPAWSPDGKRIAFCRNADGNPEVFVMAADGSGEVNLTSNEAFDGDPTWAPDGKTIAFASNRSGRGFHLYVMRPDGTAVRRVNDIPNPLGYVYPAWAPAGGKVAYTDAGENALEVFVRDPAAGKRTPVTRLGGLNTQAAWSPDGKQLAFLHVDAEDVMNPVASLHVINADGSGGRVISKRDVPLEGGRPAWKPR